jgi:hypothetical protein
MQRLKQLGFMRVALLDEREAEQRDGRIMHLFRNRIELKKSFSNAQDEIQRLKDRVKQQEGATARVQELLQGLEERLAQPETGYQALVFYQLKDLWSLGQRLLRQFIAELEARQLERERKHFFADFNRRMFSRRQAVESEYLQAEGVAAERRARVSQLERTHADLRRFWHYSRRRAVRRELQAAGVQVVLAEQALADARAARDALSSQQAEFGGLSIDARRAINHAAIADGHLLRERLARTGLFEATQRASARREPAADEYGSRTRCERLMHDIQRARLLLEERSDVPSAVRAHSDALRKLAQYRGDGDSVPEAASLAAEQQGAVSLVLSEDCWEIYRVLLR